MESMNAPPGFEREALRVWLLSSGEEYPCSSYPKLLIGWDWAREWGREKVRPPLYGGEPMGEKLLLRSLDDVEGEVGFDGVRTRPLVLLLKELGGPKDCGNNWVSGRDKSNNGKKIGYLRITPAPCVALPSMRRCRPF